MAINFSGNPYYDDYNQTKGYHRILFKPSVAVQARELTQLQTILNNQITQFGNHVFIDGSLVIPGQAALDVEYHSVKVVENTSAVVDANGNPSNTFLGKVVVGGTTGIRAKVINATGADEDGNPPTLFVKYLDSGTNGTTKKFANSETITVEGGSAFVTAITPVAPETSATYTGTAYTITSGIMYIKGNFVYFDDQTYIINKYGKANNIIIGFDVEESVKSFEDDNTLLDPAQGSYNFSAPGADRYFIGLTLAERELTANVNDDENFVELIRVQNFKVISKKPNAQYNFLADEFARRTFDESGNYIVRPYDLKLLEETDFYNSSTSGSANKFVAKISPGKAYVKGYELDSLQTMAVTIDKARDTQIVTNGSTFLPFGNYLLVDNVVNIPSTIATIPQVTLYNATAGGGSAIGTAFLRFLEYSSGTVGTTSAQYKAFLFNVTVNAGSTFAEVESIGTGSFTADTAEATATLKDQSKRSHIFPMPRDYISGFTNNATQYDARAVFTGTLDANSNIQLNATIVGGTTFASFSPDNYQMIITSGANTGDYIALNSSMFTFSSGNTVVDIDIGTSNTGANVIVLATVSKSGTNANKKTKTLNTNSTVTLTTSSTAQATNIPLGKADIYRLVSVKMDIGGFASPTGSYTLDITDRYTLDDGQRSTHYGLGLITLGKGKAKPTGPIRITFDYFTHGAGDYFSVDSYASIDYADIPAPILDGVEYILRDCLDFRPRINDAGTGFSGTGASVGAFPDYENDLTTTYSYYLGKITKIVLDKKGALKAIDGESDLNPKEPLTPEDAMALYVLTQDPYVLDIVENIRIKRIDNRRYTMSDIGNLETRLKNVEYYVSLNLLELDAQQYQIQDASGNDLYKNGFVVDSFTGHGVGDVYNPDYSCAVDQNKRELRPKSDAYFYKLIEVNTNDSQRTSDGYALTGDLILLDYTEEAFATNTKFSESLTLNPYNMITHVGVISGINSDVWFEYKQAPDVYVNDSGDYDSLLNAASVSNKQGTFWGEWSPRIEYDDQGRVAKTWDERYEYQYNTVQETIETATISKMRDVTIHFNVQGLKPSTRLYVFFSGINVTRDCKPIRGSATNVDNSFNILSDTAENIITNSSGEIEIEFKYSANKYKLNTGKHLLRVSDSETGNTIEETTSAELVFNSRGELRTVQDTIISTRVGKYAANEDVRNYIVADPINEPRDIIPIGESTETLLDNGLVEIDTVIVDNTYNGNGTYTVTQRTVTTIVDPIVVTGTGDVITEPISNTIDPDYPVDHTGYIETMFMAAMGRYPNAQEKAELFAEAASRGITDTTVANSTYTEGFDQNGNPHTFVSNDGSIDTFFDTNLNLRFPQTYSTEFEQLGMFIKDMSVKYSDVALDAESSVLAQHVRDLNTDVETASWHIGLKAVLAMSAAKTGTLDNNITWKDAATVASVKL